MDIEEIKTKVRANEYMYSQHADLERKADDLTVAQVEDALHTVSFVRWNDVRRMDSPKFEIRISKSEISYDSRSAAIC